MSSLPEKFSESQIERISAKTIGVSLMAILNLERGIFHTIREMIKHPGEAMRRYMFSDRTGFIDPLKFLVLTIPIYLFMTSVFFPEVGFMAGLQEGILRSPGSGPKEEVSKNVNFLIEQFLQYTNLVLLISVPITALFTRFLFRKYRLYFGEHLVLNAYLYSFLTFAGIFFLPTSWISPAFNMRLMLVIYIVYTAYFLHSFFQFSWWKAFANTILLQLFGFFILVITLVVYLITGIVLMGGF